MEELLEMSRASCRGDIVYATDGQSEGDDVFQGLVDEAYDEKGDVADPHGHVSDLWLHAEGLERHEIGFVVGIDVWPSDGDLTVPLGFRSIDADPGQVGPMDRVEAVCAVTEKEDMAFTGEREEHAHIVEVRGRPDDGVLYAGRPKILHEKLVSLHHFRIHHFVGVEDRDVDEPSDAVDEGVLQQCLIPEVVDLFARDVVLGFGEAHAGEYDIHILARLLQGGPVGRVSDEEFLDDLRNRWFEVRPFDFKIFPASHEGPHAEALRNKFPDNIPAEIA